MHFCCRNGPDINDAQKSKLYKSVHVDYSRHAFVLKPKIVLQQLHNKKTWAINLKQDDNMDRPFCLSEAMPPPPPATPLSSFPSKGNKSLHTLQTIFHLCIAKQDLAKAHS